MLISGAGLATYTAHAAVHYEILRSFGPPPDGALPVTAPMQGSDGALYGTTAEGGVSGGGTAFRVNLDGSGYAVLHSFSTNGIDGVDPEARLLEGLDGALYGTTYHGGPYTNGWGDGFGTVFRLHKDGSGYTVLHNFGAATNDGVFPLGALVEGTHGMLYGTTTWGGTYTNGTVFKLNKDGSGYTVLHNFGSADGGRYPCGLVQGADGALFGTTSSGGTNGAGTVFRISEDGNAYTILHVFGLLAGDGDYPEATLMLGSDGALYGTTVDWISNALLGTVFKLNQDGTGYVVLHSFSTIDGTPPWGEDLVEGRDGALYGATQTGGVYTNLEPLGFGTVFKLSKDGTDYRVLYNFSDDFLDWGNPCGLTFGTNGALYGATRLSDGTIFTLNTDGSGYAILHNFGPNPLDEMSPFGGLVAGSDGALYGVEHLVTDYRPQSGVFKLDARGGGYTLLHSFSTNWIDADPGAGLLEGQDGALYGTTYLGGAYTNAWFLGSGTVFKLNKDGSDYETLHSFGSGLDGQNPQAGLVQGRDGALYGTTYSGGAYTNWYASGLGTVFKLNPDGSNYTVLHNFGSGLDGVYPHARLVEGTDGALYGTTAGGGAYTNSGTVFRLKQDGSGYTVLHSFGATANDGAYPESALLEATDGTLYGTTIGGGNGSGTVFKLSKDGSGYGVLYSFGAAGSWPSPSELVEGRDGALYGSTYSGGAYTNRQGDGFGTIFKLNKDGSGYTVLHNFWSASDGQLPEGGLVEGADGALLGTTSEGGMNGAGTVFKLWPPETPDILDVRASPEAAQVSFAGVSGYHYQLLRSTDLLNWTPFPIITMPASGIFTNLDSVSATGSAFYRATWLP